MKLLIGIATAVIMATSAQAQSIGTILIEREGNGTYTITRNATATGKVPPQPVRPYVRDGNGNLRDPVTGRLKGVNY